MIGGVVTSFLLDQVFDDPSSFPLGLMIWPPFVFYRALGILNINATSTRKPAYTLSKLRPGDPIFFSFLVLAAEGILIVLVAIYTTQVIPSGVGRPKPWYYPFRDIWAYFKKDKVVPTESSLDIAENNPNEDVEEADVHAERIKIRKGRYSDDTPLVVHNLSKTYDASSKVPKEAVRNISFEVGNGVVFGLLGPNGAGKTSLISMLTGVTQPDHGTAKIAGLDIADNPGYAFRSIGVCPQFDILWEDLTIEDHLYFYARLKGVAIAFESDAVTAALQLVELSALRTRTVKQLSGGEKRRVSIAISLVSDPKVILFDEPTVT